MSQEELARLCRVPANTIKSIEVGRLKLTPAVLKNIRESTGARWDDKKVRWMRFHDDNAFTFEDYIEYRDKLLCPTTLEQATQSGLMVLIHCRIEWLFDNVPRESWNSLRSAIDSFLEECKQEFKLNKNDAAFFFPVRSAKDSDYARFSKASQQKLEALHQQKVQALQKREHASKKPVKGSYAAAGNKKRKPLYLRVGDASC